MAYCATATVGRREGHSIRRSIQQESCSPMAGCKEAGGACTGCKRWLCLHAHVLCCILALHRLTHPHSHLAYNCCIEFLQYTCIMSYFNPIQRLLMLLDMQGMATNGLMMVPSQQSGDALHNRLAMLWPRHCLLGCSGPRNLHHLLDQVYQPSPIHLPS
jgi:hypothetical protein